MGYTVTLYNNSSPVEKIGKTLSNGTNFTCLFKQDTSILKPVINIRTSTNLTGFNYMYITELNRYYFIDDIKLLNDNNYEISGLVDVLDTYASQIKANSAVIKRQQHEFNLYLDDPEFKTYNNELVQTKKFAGTPGWTKNLHYVLVINGS